MQCAWGKVIALVASHRSTEDRSTEYKSLHGRAKNVIDDPPYSDVRRPRPQPSAHKPRRPIPLTLPHASPLNLSRSERRAQQLGPAVRPAVPVVNLSDPRPHLSRSERSAQQLGPAVRPAVLAITLSGPSRPSTSYDLRGARSNWVPPYGLQCSPSPSRIHVPLPPLTIREALAATGSRRTACSARCHPPRSVRRPWSTTRHQARHADHRRSVPASPISRHTARHLELTWR